MGKRQSKTLTNVLQTPETISYKQVKYSVCDRGYRENYKDTQRETSRTVKIQNIEQPTNE